VSDEDPRPGAPGLREQLRATVGAARSLVEAHLELAKAELAEIVEEIQRVAILVGIAVAALLFIAVLVPVGLVLFVGEWLFGSIGWGLLLGTELCIAAAITALVVGLRVERGVVRRAIGAAVAIGIVFAVVLGAALTNEAWTRLGASVASNVEVGVRPLVVATIAIAIVGALVGVALAVRAGAAAAIGGALSGGVAGALVGALSAVRFGPGPGAALGVAVGLGAWTTFLGIGLARSGVDTDALKARFWPAQTIETTKETIEWVRERTPLGPRR